MDFPALHFLFAMVCGRLNVSPGNPDPKGGKQTFACNDESPDRHSAGYCRLFLLSANYTKFLGRGRFFFQLYFIFDIFCRRI
jgi:hypothetical protein